MSALIFVVSVTILASTSGCQKGGDVADEPSASARPAGPTSAEESARAGGTREAGDPPEDHRVAVFAGGCFWCMEPPFEALDGVFSVLSGYTGGEERAPTYREVSSGRTGHYEAIRVEYDPERIDYQTLLEVFLHNVDPTMADGQFCDRGRQYRTAIFVSNDEERRLSREALAEAEEELGEPIVTEILAGAPFWIAEAYHQDFHRTHPAHYARYRRGCGRDARLRELWGASAGH